MKKIINVLVVLVLGAVIVNQVNLQKENNKLEEEKLVNAYITCLEESHTQRNYCANKVSNKSYQTLDNLIKKYGYSYKQVGYDLFIEKVEK